MNNIHYNRPSSSITLRFLLCLLLIAPSSMLSGCYSYRLATHAQPGTDKMVTGRMHAYSLFWGALNKPQVIQTPSCDALGLLGVSEVNIKNNFGNALLTVITLGIYCPVVVEWKCSKSCPQTGEL